MNQNIYINEIPSAELTIYDNGTPVTVVIANGAVSQNKVPYTGATQNVNLGEYGISAGFVQLDTTPTTYTPAVGNMGWNDSEGTIDLLLKGGVVSLPLGQKQVARVVNGTGGNVLKSNYQVVKVTGAQGQRLQVNLAQANNDANSADTLGLIAENINNNNSGFIITSGLVENINTTGSLQSETWTDGNILYLSPTTPGAITNVKPQAPNHTVIVGFVVYAHANNGKIFVKVDNGYELDELHNVLINTGTLANGQVLKYNSSLQVWENNTDAAGTGTVTQVNALTLGTTGTDLSSSVANSTTTPTITLNVPTANATNRGVLSSTDWTTFNNKQNALTNPVTGTGTSGQVAYWNGTTTQTGSNNLFWDAANNRLGIGTTTPGNTLHLSASNTSNSQVRIGTLEIQNFSLNNSWFGDNIYYNGTNFIARQTGFTGMFYFYNNEGQFRLTTSLSAGASAGTSNNVQLKINSDGTLAIGSGVSTTPGNYTNAKLLFFGSTGNLALNSTTDSGQRLQVTGDTLLKGSGNTSGTTALTVQNSDGTQSLAVRNDGVSFFGISNNYLSISNNSAGTNPKIISGFWNSGTPYGIQIQTNLATDTAVGNGYGVQITNAFGYSYTSGTYSSFNLGTHSFRPTSGTGVFNALLINHTINQTGGANGITRGLYVNPTLTAAADWRSIEWSNNTGWGLYGAGTANNYLAGDLAIGGTTIDANYAIQVNSSKGIRISGSGGGFGYTIVRGTETTTIANNASATVIASTNVLQFNTAATERLRIFSNGNVGIGVAGTDAGQKLQVTGDTLLKGSGNTSGTTALTVQNSDGTNILNVRNDGAVQIGSQSTGGRPYLAGYTGFTEFGASQTSLGIVTQNTGRPDPGILIRNTSNFTHTSNTGNYLVLLTNYSPTSGTGLMNNFVIQPTINQTGGANGITRGLYVNPTITAAADWRSIETSNNTGYALYLGGSADAFFNDGTDFQFGTTTGTKIGTATSQKLGFWNATPIVQPTTGVASATRVGGGGTTLTDTDTFDGYTLAQIVKALRNTGILA